MEKLLKLKIEALAKALLNENYSDNIAELQEMSKELYEHLTVLKYVMSSMSGESPIPAPEKVVENTPVAATPKVEAAPVVESAPVPETPQKIEATPVAEPTPEPQAPPVVEAPVAEVQKEMENADLISTLDENLFVSNEPIDEDLIEPATEKIKDIVAQMPPEAQQIEEILKDVIAQPVYEKNDMEEVTPAVANGVETEIKQKSLNDRLKKGITIGLNDRIAFVKHLFDGSTEDFNRVISQLNTIESELEALEFLNGMVKPEYNNWEGKEDYEQRFLTFIEGRF